MTNEIGSSGADGGTAYDADARAQGANAALAELIVRSATDFAIVTSTPDGVISSWSPGAEKIMGWIADEAVGRSVELFFTPEDVAGGELQRERAAARDVGCATDERWHMKKDGSRFWASGELQPLREAGEIVGFVKILRDRTEQYEMQQRLEATQRDAKATSAAADKVAAEQAAILGQLGEGVIATDADGRITFVNAAAERLHGVAKLDVEPDEYTETYHLLTEDGAPYPPAELPLARAVLRGETVTDARWRIRRPDGSEVLAIGNARPVVVGGEKVGAVLTVRDDTERHAAEQALRRSEARIRSVLEGMDEGFIKIDRDFRIVEINEEGLRIDGRERGSLVGRHILEVWPETERLPNWPMFNKAMRTGKPGTVEYRHVSDVHDVWLETRAYPIEHGLAIFYRDVTERRAAQDALKEQEREFRELADNIPTLCWTAHADGHIYWYNKRWYEYTGTTPDTQEGWGWASVHDPDCLPSVAERWTRSIENGAPFEMTFPLKGADGEFRHFLTRIVPIRGEPTSEHPDGPVLRWFGTNTDVEDQRIAETAMRTSEARYRTLFEAIDAGFCVIELVRDAADRPVDYRFLEINPAFEQQSGLRNAVGYGIRELAPDTDQRWIDLYDRVVRSRDPVRYEDFFPGLDRWFDVYAYPVDAPELRRVAVLFNDVSERKRAELQLQELNRTLEARVAETVAERDMIWRTSQDLFVVSDLQGMYKSTNPAWFDVLGYTPDELVGSLAGRFIHPDDVETARAELAPLARGEVVNGLDLRMMRKDGGFRWISWTCVPQNDVFYASGRDVTARKELEEQLRQSQKMEAVGQLTGGIAHDFNNLLTIVSGNIDMAKRSLGPDGDARVLRSLGNATKGADRAAALTQRLLAFSRRQPLQPRATDVDKLIAGMSELLDRALGETVELEVVAGARLWRVEVDPNQLENAVLNLAVNARDAMPSGGKLTIETTNSHIDEAYAAARTEVAPGQYVLISITDTGEGMAPEIVAKAFDPFFSTKEVGKGTGLGLSMVYGYVKQSGGHVAIYSEPGQGTTIKLYLPRLIAEMHGAEEEEAKAAPALQGQETILVVEDDDDVRIYTVDSLRELGYRVLEAHDGASALRLLERQDEPVRLLLTDVVMPGMSGRELADKAREAWPEMRTLFTTGYARNAIVHGGRLDPGVELLPKPFTFDALAAKVREVLEKTGIERALILDPSADARASAAAMLNGLGLDSEPAATIQEALGKLRAGGGFFDLVVLSDALPVGNLDAVIAELHAIRAALPILVLSANAADALTARYADVPCVASAATPMDEAALRARLRTLKIRCADAM